MIGIFELNAEFLAVFLYTRIKEPYCNLAVDYPNLTYTTTVYHVVDLIKFSTGWAK